MKGRKWLAGGVAGAALVWAGGEAPGQQPTVVPAAATSIAQGKPAALVNGQQISMTELELVLQQAQLTTKTPFEVPEGVQKQMRRQALAMLIDDVLMHQWLKANTTPITKAEVDAKIAEMDAAMQKEKKSVEAFCKENGQTIEQLRENLGNMLQWSKWAQTKVDDAATLRYFQENKEFFEGVEVRASHIVLLTPPTAPEAEKAKLRGQLTELRNQILAGKIDFATAAKTYSQCQDTRAKGGEIGSFSRKGMVEEPLAKAAFAMQPNQLSDIVQTVYGYHLVLVTERKPGKPVDFAKIKDQVRDFAIEEIRQQILVQQRQAAKIDVNIP